MNTPQMPTETLSWRLMQRTLEQVDIAIVVALALESRPLCERLAGTVRLQACNRRVTVGRLGSRSLAVIEAGVGQTAAEQATQLVIDGHRPRQAIIAAGLCGGLAPAVTRSTIIVPETLGRTGAADTRALPPLSTPHRTRPTAVGGLLLTDDAVVATRAAKQALHATTGAVAVDMESWWVAAVAARAGLPCHVVRAVSDAATDSIAPDVATLATQASAARQAGAALRLAWRRPAAIGELAELRERAHRAADALANFLVEAVTQ
jgi:nucleoside phosphorylase